MKFHKYHALGNDYLVLDPKNFDAVPSPDVIRRICHRNLGIGSDGILWGPFNQVEGKENFNLRIFNPDGSEAEKSGNGLRIFCRYLWDQHLVASNASFQVNTKGGVVKATVHPDGQEVTVSMGKVSFASNLIPVKGDSREVLQEELLIGDQVLEFSAATIGNPHCVIRTEQTSPEMAKKFGPMIENNLIFPNRSNVQFLEILDRKNLKLEIWERGAGYTLASGSSSSAAAAVARKLDWCDRESTVHMPGGTLQIIVQEDFQIIMKGGVTKVFGGEADGELFSYEFMENRA
ncbi:MAG: diaminopimelate epimerase [SAR324 cluster bacterium]|nr:diaminopimelate epimerase [SAR324 cluster bacterium]